MVQNNRSLFKFIFLTIITCGLYSLYFVHAIARDVNIICAGDGKQTAGLLKYLLFSLLTCGIYSYVWYYKLGNRLVENGPKYGIGLAENGTSVLVWMIFGSLLCGIGPFVALNIIIKNTNQLATAYLTK